MKNANFNQEEVDLMTYNLLKAVLESPNLKTKIESIRTGGQTGFDEAGAKAAIKLGIPTLVLAPKGWKFRNESGQDISDEKQFKARFENVIPSKPETKPEVKPEESKPIPVDDHILTEATAMENIDLLEQQKSLDVLQSAFWGILQGRAVKNNGGLVTKEFFEENYSSILESAIPNMLTAYSEADPDLIPIKNNYPYFKTLLIASRLKNVGVSEEQDIDENTNDRDGVVNKSSVMFDAAETAKDEVRYMFNLLFKSEGLTNKILSQYNYSEAMNKTMNLLGGSTTLAQQIELLSNSDLPFKDQILNYLGVTDKNKLENEAKYERTRTSFFEQFSKAKSEFHITNLAQGNSFNALDASIKQSIRDKAKSTYALSKFVEIRSNGKYKIKKSELAPLSNNPRAFITALGFNVEGVELSNDALEAIYKIINSLNDLNYNVSWLDDPKFSESQTEIRGYLNTLISELAKAEKLNRKLQIRNADGESQSSVHNHSFFTRKFNKLKTGLIAAKTKFEQAIAAGKVKYTIISGSINFEKSKSFNKLPKVDLYNTAITNMFSPGEFVYSLPRTSDKSLEQGISIERGESRDSEGNFIPEDVYMNQFMYTTDKESRELLIQELYERYKTDLALGKPEKFTKNFNSPKTYWANILKQDEVVDVLEYDQFKDKYLKYVDESSAELMAEFNDKLYMVSATRQGKSYIKTVIKPKILQKFVSKDAQFTKLPMAEQLAAIDRLTNAYVFNSMYYGYQVSKTFYGTFTGTKSAADFFKRTSAMIAETRSNDLSPEKVNFIKENRHESMKNFGSPNRLKIKIHSETFSPSSEEFKQIAENIIGQKKTIYNENNVDDGQAKIHFGIYREIQKFVNRWSKEQEAVYNKLMNNQILTKEEEKVTFPPLKPVGFDLVADNGNEIPVFLKCAAYPLIPGAIKGTKNESTYNLMVQEGIGLVGPDSIIKNARPKSKPEYKNNEAEPDADSTFEMSMEGFGIQVDVNPKEGFKQLQGTQFRKLIESNLVANGESSEEVKKWLDKNHETLSKLAKIEYDDLKNRIVNNNAVDNAALKKMLLEQLYERGATTNQVNSIIELFDGQTKFVDTVPNRTKLMNVINSLVTNNIVRLYTNGSTLVQISQAGWELKKLDSKNPTDEEIDAIKPGIKFISNEAKRKYYKNDGLGFLTWEEDGKKIGAAEIILPEKFRQYVKTDKNGDAIIDDEKVLINIGYRIPTQGLNSILHLKVVGYLPAYMEQVIIMPKEITSQGGSDFDVDKINLYVPNTVRYKGKLVYVDQNVVDKADDIYNALIESKISAQEKAENQEELNKITKSIVKMPSREEFKKALEKQKLQNELLANSLEILENGELTLKQLITPNSSDKLKDIANKLYPNQDKIKYGELFEPKTLVDITAQMYGAKSLVGVFAAQSVHHVLGQQVGLHLNNSRPYYFDHNKIEVYGQMKPSLAGVYKTDGKTLISEMVGNQYLTASVDAAKDPFLFVLGVNGTTANVVCLMERLGVDTDYIMNMLKQPIIKQYLDLIENNDSLSYGATRGFKMSKNNIIQELIGNGMIEYTAPKDLKADARAKRNAKGEIDLTKTLTKEEELMILDDFLFLNDDGRLLSDAIANTKFDTTGPGKDVIQYVLTYSNYQNFLKNSQSASKGTTLNTLVDRIQKDYSPVVENTIMKTFKDNIENSMNILYNNMSVLLSNDQVKNVFDLFNSPESKIVFKNLKEDEAETVYEGILNYIVQNNLGLIKKYFVGPNSTAAKVVAIQQDPNHPLNYLFKTLFSVRDQLLNDAPAIITVNNAFIDKTLQESIETEFSKMQESHPQLFKELVYISFFQSGFTKSPASIEQFIPAKVRMRILQPILNQFSDNLTRDKKAISKILSNIGSKLSNIPTTYLRVQDGAFGQQITLISKDSPFIKVVSGSNQMIYELDPLASNSAEISVYNPVPNSNYRTLFTNYTDVKLNMAMVERADDEATNEITSEQLDEPVEMDTFYKKEMPLTTVNMLKANYEYKDGSVYITRKGVTTIATPSEANQYLAWKLNSIVKKFINQKDTYILPKNISQTGDVDILNSKLESLDLASKREFVKNNKTLIQEIAKELYKKYC